MGIGLKQIRDFCESEKIQFTDHALKRAIERGIDIKNDIIPALLNGEIIEEYPDDYPYESCLILGITLNGEPLHVVCATGDEALWIITEYVPNNTEWESDFKTRKKVL